jgi:hypothetical protein
MKIAGTLELNPLRMMTIERMNYWVNYAVTRQAASRTPGNPTVENLACTLNDLKVLGLHLYQLLFSEKNIRDAFEKIFRQVRQDYQSEPDLRLRLYLVFEPETERLASLPWEFLLVAPNDNLDIGVFMAGEPTELLLTRKIEVPEQVRNLVPGSKTLTILLVASQPKNIDHKPLDTVDEREIDEVLKTIQTLGSSTRSVKVEVVRDPSYDQLKQSLKDHTPQIVHYIGHGSEGKIALAKSEYDDDYDINLGGMQFRWISAQEVGRLFSEPPRPRLVFLSACKGAAVEMAESFKSTARELVYAGVPGVVAMQFSITNANAKTFAKRFYEEVGKGKEIDEAVKMGRQALGELYPPWSHPRFATPVVYLQSTDPFVSPSELEQIEEGIPAAAISPLSRGSPAVEAPQTANAPEPRADRQREPSHVDARERGGLTA